MSSREQAMQGIRTWQLNLEIILVVRLISPLRLRFRLQSWKEMPLLSLLVHVKRTLLCLQNILKLIFLRVSLKNQTQMMKWLHFQVEKDCAMVGCFLTRPLCGFAATWSRQHNQVVLRSNFCYICSFPRL